MSKFENSDNVIVDPKDLIEQSKRTGLIQTGLIDNNIVLSAYPQKRLGGWDSLIDARSMVRTLECAEGLNYIHLVDKCELPNYALPNLKNMMVEFFKKNPNGDLYFVINNIVETHTITGALQGFVDSKDNMRSSNAITTDRIHYCKSLDEALQMIEGSNENDDIPQEQ